jgi:hypothetical protein
MDWNIVLFATQDNQQPIKFDTIDTAIDFLKMIQKHRALEKAYRALEKTHRANIKKFLKKAGTPKINMWAIIKKELDSITEFVCRNIVKTKQTEKTDRIICKEAYLTYIDWMNENYSDTRKLQLREFQKHIEKLLNQKYHSSSRVKMTKDGELTGKQADGWWGYLSRKEYLAREPDDDYDDSDDNAVDNI